MNKTVAVLVALLLILSIAAVTVIISEKKPEGNVPNPTTATENGEPDTTKPTDNDDWSSGTDTEWSDIEQVITNPPTNPTQTPTELTTPNTEAPANPDTQPPTEFDENWVDHEDEWSSSSDIEWSD